MAHIIYKIEPKWLSISSFHTAWCSLFNPLWKAGEKMHSLMKCWAFLCVKSCISSTQIKFYLPFWVDLAAAVGPFCFDLNKCTGYCNWILLHRALSKPLPSQAVLSDQSYIFWWCFYHYFKVVCPPELEQALWEIFDVVLIRAPRAIHSRDFIRLLKHIKVAEKWMLDLWGK